jgi:hypothetical protein
MIDKLKFTSASDKDIYDLLMSARQKMSEKILRSLALERGIMYSEETDRGVLCELISQLPHDYNSIVKLIDTREQSSRSEKRTFACIPVQLSMSELDQVINNYRANSKNSDEILLRSKRSNAAHLNVAYEELDYSKTRLMQRQTRDADVEISIENGQTIIRTPSSDKADEIVSSIAAEIERIKLQKISATSITMDGLGSEQRTLFFLKLIGALPDYKLRTVVNMRIASEVESDDDDGDSDIENDRVAGHGLVGKVNDIAMSGVNLLQSNEYQNLRKSGFFITSMTWQADQISKPKDLLQFEVSFRSGRQGTGFRFNARIARRLQSGELTDDFKPLTVSRQPSIWRMIEGAAQGVLANLKRSPSGSGVVP